MMKLVLTATVMLLHTIIGSTGAVAEPQDSAPKLQTNQKYIESAQRPTRLNIDKPLDVLHYLLLSLDNKVTVYPTENYFYFSFVHNGVPYAGNLRLDAEDRDRGIIHLSYFVDSNAWTGMETGGVEKTFDTTHGVTVAKQDRLTYSVSHRGRTVVFELNDLTNVTPPPGTVRDDETLIGPMQDESGIRFFLVFNKTLKIFHYILDETVATPDRFTRIKQTQNLSIGTRTGFIFYSDDHSKRKILVGVASANVSVNNYLDGPFDQLPDNFIKGNTLKDAILAASPEMKGKTDRFGNSPDDQTRYLIAPYIVYDTPGEVQMIEECAKREDPPVYYGCFSFAE